jgi:hypothetical protein
MTVADTNATSTFYESDRIQLLGGASYGLANLRIERFKKDETGVFETSVGKEEFSRVDQLLFDQLRPGVAIRRGNGHFTADIT